MSQKVPPVDQFEFGGLYLAGNPIRRPRGTADVCENFRVMPGNFLRLRSGRWARINATNALAILKIHSCRAGGQSGSATHLVQINYSGVVKIVKLTLPGFTWDEAGIETIKATAATQGRWIASENLSLITVYSNGYNGDNEPTNNGYLPGLSSYAPTTGNVRYFGLAPKSSGSAPSVSFAAGAGNNQVTTKVTIYAGLYNSATEHYSNTISLGSITTTGATGTITANNLGSMKFSSHGAGETAELFLVFYSTIDGLQTPYLILDSSLAGPYKVAVGSTSASLSIASGTVNGWVLDLTKRMPTRNNAPRQMKAVAFAGGRCYGILDPVTTSGSSSDPIFLISEKDAASVVYSEAEGGSRVTQFLGDPLQSWPLLNTKPLPSAERPLDLMASSENTEVVVWTPSKTFILREQADNLHEWITASDIHGYYASGERKVAARTRHGICWVTQRGQIAILRNNSREVEILSREYHAFTRGKTPFFATYIYDPINDVDAYFVQYNDASAIYHDFSIGPYASKEPAGGAIAWEYGETLVDTSGNSYFCFAGGNPGHGIHTHEGQPDQSNQVPAKDKVFNSASGQTTTDYEITGIWRANWNDFGDWDWRKEVDRIKMVGDPGGSTATILRWWADFVQQTAGNSLVVNPVKTPQSTTDRTYDFKISTGNKFWYKFQITMVGHSSDLATPYYPNVADEGTLATNFYGTVLGLKYTLANSRNVNG